MVTQDERWDIHYAQVMGFMQREQRRPSKYVPAERALLNWVKYNKKILARGEFLPERASRFRHLLSVAEQLRRKNQYK